MRHVAAVVLAAGAATRLGRSKASLRKQPGGPTLFRSLLDLLLESPFHPVLVVTGSRSTVISRQIRKRDGVSLVHNELWQGGMAGSIRLGVRAVPPDSEGALLLGLDQPALSARHLAALYSMALLPGKMTIASLYGGTWGTPAIFGRARFPELRALTGRDGAKKLLVPSPSMAFVPFPGGERDLDTPEDVAAWKRDDLP